jgi:uncharacterized repeat protein (TIGR01451 family)
MLLVGAGIVSNSTPQTSAATTGVVLVGPDIVDWVVDGSAAGEIAIGAGPPSFINPVNGLAAYDVTLAGQAAPFDVAGPELVTVSKIGPPLTDGDLIVEAADFSILSALGAAQLNVNAVKADLSTSLAELAFVNSQANVTLTATNGKFAEELATMAGGIDGTVICGSVAQVVGGTADFPDGDCDGTADGILFVAGTNPTVYEDGVVVAHITTPTGVSAGAETADATQNAATQSANYAVVGDPVTIVATPYSDPDVDDPLVEASPAWSPLPCGADDLTTVLTDWQANAAASGGKSVIDVQPKDSNGTSLARRVISYNSSDPSVVDTGASSLISLYVPAALGGDDDIVSFMLLCSGGPGAALDPGNPVTITASGSASVDMTVTVGPTFTVEIDMVKDGNSFCQPVDNVGSSAVNSTYPVAVCAMNYPLKAEPPDTGIGVFAFQVVYDNTKNSCTDKANVGRMLDDNPDLNVTLGTNGTATGATGTTLTDNVAVWITDEWAGYRVMITKNTGVGQIRTVTANTVDTLTVDAAWTTTPDATSEYDVVGSPQWPSSMGDDLGGGWDCTGFGSAPPVCDKNLAGDPATMGRAYLGCGSLNGPFTLGDDESDNVLGVVTFKALNVSQDLLKLANVTVGDETAAEVGTCNPGIGFPIPCTGWDGVNPDSSQVAAPMDPAEDNKDNPPDIKVTKTCDTQVLVGDPITCSIKVENIGTGPATAVSLSDVETTSPKSLDFVSAGAPCAAFVTTGVGGSINSCPLGAIAPAGSVTVALNLTAVGPAESHNINSATATVTSGLADGDPSNNTSTAEIHEFLPDINVTKLDMSGGLPGAPASGWTMDLYSGACPPSGSATTKVTAGSGVASFDDLAVGTYCVKETLIDPAKWLRVSCVDGVTPEADFDEEITIDGSAKDFAVTFCNKAKDVKMEKDPAIHNLWICQDPHPGDQDQDCYPANGEGSIVIDENVSNASGDPQGVGAYEFQVKFDHKIFDIVVSDTGWLYSTGRIPGVGGCTMTIISENDIRFGCVSKDDPQTPGIDLGPKTNETIATLTVTPESDMRLRLTPGQQNGVVRTILDENCELADIYGDPLRAGSTDQDGDQAFDEDPINGVDDDGDTSIDEDWVDEALLPGIQDGGLVAVCSDTTLTVRILEGDLNTDCEVDVIDDQMIAFRYGAFFGNLLYDPWFDLEPALKDFDIDIKDLQKVFGRNGSTCEVPIPPQDPLGPPP